jgi:uncharacterized membrane protein
MSAWRSTIRDRIRSSYLFLPLVLTFACLLLAFGMTAIDRTLPVNWQRWLGGLSATSVENQRALLQVIAGSMVTVASLVFSITVVVLALAAQEFGPQLIYTFKSDWRNQLVFGTFTGTFVYCVMVLRLAYQPTPDEVVIPQVSTIVGLAMALASIVVLIYFIHHITEMIQSPAVISRVGAQLDTIIERVYSEETDGRDTQRGGDQTLPEDDGDSRLLVSRRQGVLQAVDDDLLLRTAEAHDLQIEVLVHPGRFVMQRQEVIRARSCDHGDVPEDGLLDALTFGYRRTAVQDIAFVFNQLVEVAIRALSPGINDAFTGLACIDRLGAGLARISNRQRRSPYRKSSDGKLRVIVPSPTFAELVDTAFDQIRQSGRPHVAVNIRLLQVLAGVVSLAPDPDQHDALLRQGRMIWHASRDAAFSEEDHQAIRASYDHLKQLCEEKRAAA